MSTNHTPGPWHWEEGKGDDLPKLMASSGKVCDFGDDTRYYPTAGEPPNEADSRLIAAAPDLLAALQGLDEAYCRAGTPLSRNERTEDRKRLIAARAAIEKATKQ